MPLQAYFLSTCSLVALLGCRLALCLCNKYNGTCTSQPRTKSKEIRCASQQRGGIFVRKEAALVRGAAALQPELQTLQWIRMAPAAVTRCAAVCAGAVPGCLPVQENQLF